MKAFSLIETLVVVAIIALLIAISLPVLSGARDSAWMIECSQQQQQLGIAMQMYAHDYDEWNPRSAGDYRQPIWCEEFRPYLDDIRHWKDKYAQAPYYHDPARRIDDAHKVHYTVNGMAFRKRYQWAGARRETRMSSYRYTADVAYLTCFGDDEREYWGPRVYENRTNRPIGLHYDVWSPGHINGAPIDQRISLDRHGNGSVVLHLDGHCAATPATDLVDLALWDDGLYY